MNLSSAITTTRPIRKMMPTVLPRNFNMGELSSDGLNGLDPWCGSSFRLFFGGTQLSESAARRAAGAPGAFFVGFPM
jgi:hypothetical protein